MKRNSFKILILFFIILGFYLIGVGYHNIDLGFNLAILEKTLNIELSDMGMFGIQRTPRSMFFVGLDQIYGGAFCLLFAIILIFINFKYLKNNS